MPQRAIIGINGDLLPFSETLDRLRTAGLGGSAVTWVPEADTRCETLKATANGTYRAADAGKYGYDYVTVSVPGSGVTGKDPDTGEEVHVTTDPETGEIVETVIPTEIRVITPPAKIDYADGETINYSGIVVHAYSSTGQDMGAVPFNELVFPVKTADFSSTVWSDGQGLNAMMLYYTPHQWVHRNNLGIIDDQGTNYVHGSVLGKWSVDVDATYGNDYTPDTLLATRYGAENYMASIAGNTNVPAELYVMAPNKHMSLYGGWVKAGFGGHAPGNKQFKKVSWERYITNIPRSHVNPITVDPTTLHAVQSLPVQWPRTPDGAVLETTFNINVTGGST